MTLDVIRIIIDFGLLVLIWMVQLIVYPSFVYYSKEELVTWHKRYTPSIAIIVGPLMIIQLAVAIYHTVLDISLFSMVYGTLIFGIWIITFALFVPLHGKVTEERFRESIPTQLVRKNWMRTSLWTAVFLISLIEIIITRGV